MRHHVRSYTGSRSRGSDFEVADQELIDRDAENDDDSEAIVWGITCNAISAKPSCACTYHHPNEFAEIFHDDNYNDDEDGDEHMLNALKNLTPNVRVGPQVLQKQRVNSSQPKPMSRRTIAGIAKQFRDGHYNLPDLQLESKL